MNFSLANFISRLGTFESNESISHPRYDSDVTRDIAKCQYFGGSLVLFLRNSGICGYISILKERATQCHHSGKILLSLMQFSVRQRRLNVCDLKCTPTPCTWPPGGYFFGINVIGSFMTRDVFTSGDISQNKMATCQAMVFLTFVDLIGSSQREATGKTRNRRAGWFWRSLWQSKGLISN